MIKNSLKGSQSHSCLRPNPIWFMKLIFENKEVIMLVVGLGPT